MTKFILTPEACNIFCFGVCSTDAKFVKPYEPLASFILFTLKADVF